MELVDVEKVKHNYRTKIESTLEDLFDEYSTWAENTSPEALDSIDKIREFTMRKGKRLRPTLVVFGYKCMTSEENEAELLRPACSLELFHNGILMQDDVADNDDIRRDGPTMHKIYEEAVKNLNAPDPRRIGEALAVNDGLVTMISLAQLPILNSSFPAENKVKALQKYCHIVFNVGFGQKKDILSTIISDVDEEYVCNVHRMKTAAYTVEGPLHLGAILGGAKDEDLEALTNYGIPVGIAFQLRDDIMGAMSTKKVRKTKNDFVEGKKTLLIVKALELGNDNQKAIINKYLGRAELKEEEIKEIQDVIRDTGSLEYSENLMRKLVEEGKNAIKDCSFEGEGKDFLYGIADYVVERKW